MTDEKRKMTETPHEHDDELSRSMLLRAHRRATKTLLRVSASGLLLEAAGVAAEAATRRLLAARAAEADAVFIWIPKCAGTSVYQFLRKAANCQAFFSPRAVERLFPQRGVVTFGHMAYHQLLRAEIVSAAFDARAFKFAFVRNPFDRAVSLFEAWRKNGGLHPKTSFLTFCHILADRAYEDIGLYNGRGLSIASPQVTWIREFRPGEVLISKFEDLNAGLAEISQRICPRSATLPSLPRLNASPRDRHSHYYDTVTHQLVAAAYAEDFATLGYDFDS